MSNILKKLKTNKTELIHLSASAIILAVAFSLGSLFTSEGLNLTSFFYGFIITLFAVVSGFLFHELAHKYVAIHFGAISEFRAWSQGLLFALFLSIVTMGSFVFAAPGAVYVNAELDRRQSGLVSVAGPLTNILIAGLGLTLLLLLKPIGLLAAILVSVLYVNLFLAAFNLLPIAPLDGSKVFPWNPIVWGILFAISAGGFFFL